MTDSAVNVDVAVIGEINVKGGMPRLFEIPRITGLPEQKIDDPALARFR